jgi:hypothetical protein
MWILLVKAILLASFPVLLFVARFFPAEEVAYAKAFLKAKLPRISGETGAA